jgi:hypothetical protein
VDLQDRVSAEELTRDGLRLGNASVTERIQPQRRHVRAWRSINDPPVRHWNQFKVSGILAAGGR